MQLSIYYNPYDCWKGKLVYTIHGCYGKYFTQVFLNRSCVVKVVISVELFWCVADATRSWCTRSGSPIQRVRAARKQTFGQLTKEPNVLRFELPKSCLIRLYGYSHIYIYISKRKYRLFRRLQANLSKHLRGEKFWFTQGYGWYGYPHSFQFVRV